MDSFIGLHMQVDLRAPAGRSVRGTVIEVEVGSSLTLSNVFIVGTNQWLPRLVIPATNIGDIHDLSYHTAVNSGPVPQQAPAASGITLPVVSPPAPATVPTFPMATSISTTATATSTATQKTQAPPPVTTGPSPPMASASFVDPAILSIGSRGKPPMAPAASSLPVTKTAGSTVPAAPAASTAFSAAAFFATATTTVPAPMPTSTTVPTTISAPTVIHTTTSVPLASAVPIATNIPTANATHVAPTPEIPASPAPSVKQAELGKDTGRGSPRLGQPGVLPAPSFLNLSRQATPKASLRRSMETMNLDGVGAGEPDMPVELEATVPPSGEQPQKRKNPRSRRKGKQGGRGGEDAGQDSPARTHQQQQPGRGKGWRQTPILQDTAQFQPYSALKRQARQKGDADNGWASEDVTEEMGEFDFESGLAMFDKRGIFDQMRKDDPVDESTRLVSHNRKAKPGTAGGKNLHVTENVLDVPSAASKPVHNDFWNSEADEAVHGGERAGMRDVRSQQSSRQSESKPGARKSQSRKTSLTSLSIQRVNSAVRFTQSPSSATSVGFSAANRALVEKQQSTRPGLLLRPSNRRLEPVSALQMLNLENIAANEVGLTEEMMTENSGRGIAEVALTALTDPAIRVRLGSAASQASSTAPGNSMVVVLAGNNKSGTRAMAAARHLRNKDINVVVCLVEREQNLLEDMKQQVRIYRNFGGRVFGKHDFFEQLRKASSSASPPVVSLIVDALLGLTVTFEELRTGDQAAVYELMEWANRNEAFVLAVDMPTGIDPSSGRVNLIDGAHLYVKPRWVVALGAPKRGLLEAITAAHEPADELDMQRDADGIARVESAEDEWKLYIADMGLGASVWKKAGTKLRKGVDFDDRWVLEMQWQGPSGGDDMAAAAAAASTGGPNDG